MNYPVIGEIWNIFEQSLMVQGKKLANDIAKHQGADPKLLWDEIRKKIKVGILDIEIPETPVTCQYIDTHRAGVVVERCRVPCLLGYSSCPEHIHKVAENIPLPPVRRILDFKGNAYFVDETGIAIDTNGITRGVVEEDVLYLFTRSKPEDGIEA
jgi:hypothetical protein